MSCQDVVDLWAIVPYYEKYQGQRGVVERVYKVRKYIVYNGLSFLCQAVWHLHMFESMQF